VLTWADQLGTLGGAAELAERAEAFAHDHPWRERPEWLAQVEAARDAARDAAAAGDGRARHRPAAPPLRLVVAAAAAASAAAGEL
jgi:hypothetical protein